jgi:hypothetical protein
MLKRQHTVNDFFEEAEAMRGALDACFENTYTDRINWHYFCDPKMYAYLRTAPQRVFPQPMFARFMQRLRQWCMDNLGLAPVGTPSLHLMVNGCRLGLHSDFHNGAWGYVYSLTRWETRRFSGGETLLLRDGVPSYKKHHVHGDVLYELVPAHFNQLLVFDDRLVHATPTIEGSMDPAEGRIAMVGHIRAASPVAQGSLSEIEARRVILDSLPHLRERIRNYRDVQGTVSYQLRVAETGVVEVVTVLTDNVVTPAVGYGSSDDVAAVKSIVHRTMSALKFPATTGKSTVIVPILIPLPDLRPIEFAVGHDAPRDAAIEWAAKHVAGIEGVDLQGHWDADTYIVTEPVAGSVRIEPREIVFSFDPPMWVPSQREHFQVTLAEWAKSLSGSSSHALQVRALS